MNLAIVFGDLKDAVSVGDELEIAEMFVEIGLLSQELDRLANPLKAHATIEQGPDYAERHKVTKGVETLDSRSPPGRLHAGFDQ